MDIPGAKATGLLLEQATAGAEQAKLDRLKPSRLPGERAPVGETQEGLAKTAREFEAVFVNTLLKAMRKTVPENKLFNGGGATKFYRQMHDAELAKAMATGHSGLGVADLIIQQFSQHLETKKSAQAVERSGNSSFSAPAEARPPIGPVQGPPAPPDAMARYQSMSPVGQRVAQMARMRGLAAAQGPAVADTLRRFEFEIGSAAVRSGLDPALILAVVMTESGGDATARSPKGATGLMQLMPGTAAEVGVSDATSPAQNLQGGSEYLARMLRKYENRMDLALAAYNAGPGNVDKAGGQVPQFRETERYVERVMALYRDLGGGTNLANSGQQ